MIIAYNGITIRNTHHIIVGALKLIHALQRREAFKVSEKLPFRIQKNGHSKASAHINMPSPQEPF